MAEVRRASMARQSLSELRTAVTMGPPYDEALLAVLQSDSRAGGRALYARCLQRRARVKSEQDRLDAMLQFEREAWANGFGRVAGVDEAGRGPVAGPIVAAAVVLRKRGPSQVSPRDGTVPVLSGLDDSKRLSPRQREDLFARLQEDGHSIGIAVVDAVIIDRNGIQSANYAAMAQAVADLSPPPGFLLVDGFTIHGCSLPQKRLVKGDRRSRPPASSRRSHATGSWMNSTGATLNMGSPNTRATLPGTIWMRWNAWGRVRRTARVLHRLPDHWKRDTCFSKLIVISCRLLVLLKGFWVYATVLHGCGTGAGRLRQHVADGFG